MPNKIKRNKRDTMRLRSAQARGDSVKDLLTRAHPALARLSDQAARQGAWRGWLAAHLPDAANTHICAVVERHDTLVIFTPSAAWSARVRFALAEVEVALKSAHPQIARVEVRVAPR